MRLQILMGTQRSHAAYRLAWANSTGERIPFLPLHRRDLVSAESGIGTFVDASETVNWQKFNILGNIVLDLQESQETFPQTRRHRNPDVQQLILGVKLVKDEDVSLSSWCSNASGLHASVIPPTPASRLS